MIKKAIAMAALAGMTTLSSGCYHMKFTTNQTGGKVTGDAKWHHNFVYFVEKDQVDLSKECPGGFTEVNHQMGALQAAIIVGASVVGSIIAIGGLVPLVWQPTEYTVACVEGGGIGGTTMPPPPTN